MSRYCEKCGKAKKACICSHIRRVESSVELIILQHPTEVRRAKGTAKILTLSLTNSRCLVGEDFTRHDELNSLISEKNTDCFLLFPGDKALPATELYKQRENTGRKTRVILIDGTWKKAFKVLQLSTNLHTLPQISLPESVKGNYRIRKSPGENTLSTVEAGYQLLRIMEPETDCDSLMTAFDAMVEFHISQMPAGMFEKHYSN